MPLTLQNFFAKIFEVYLRQTCRDLSKERFVRRTSPSVGTLTQDGATVENIFVNNARTTIQQLLQRQCTDYTPLNHALLVPESF